MRSSAAPVNKTTDLSPFCLSVHRCCVQSAIRNFCEGNADVVIPLFSFYAANPRVKHSVSFLAKLFNFHVINRVLCRHWQLRGNNTWWFHRQLFGKEIRGGKLGEGRRAESGDEVVRKG